MKTVFKVVEMVIETDEKLTDDKLISEIREAMEYFDLQRIVVLKTEENFKLL